VDKAADRVGLDLKIKNIKVEVKIKSSPKKKVTCVAAKTTSPKYIFQKLGGIPTGQIL
jgi:hypothetical protein